MLHDFEHTTKIESDKADKDRKDAASAFLAESSSSKQDALDIYSAVTKIAGETEEVQPSPDHKHNSYQDSDHNGTLKHLFSFASIYKPISASSK